MNRLRKSTAVLLAVLVMGLVSHTNAAWANENANSDGPQDNVTRHEPKVMAAPVQKIPKVKLEKKASPEMKKYLLIGLASIVVVGGTAAALSAGGDSGGDGGSESSNIDISW